LSLSSPKAPVAAPLAALLMIRDITLHHSNIVVVRWSQKSHLHIPLYCYP
jgi:hypothetical protein